MDQFERRNPGFWEVVKQVANEPRVRTNTKLVLCVRRELQRRARLAARRAAAVAQQANKNAGAGAGGPEAEVSSPESSTEASSSAAESADKNDGDEQEARAKWLRGALPGADGVDDDAARQGSDGDGEWAHRTAAQCVSAAGPAPAMVAAKPLPAVIKRFGEGVCINPSRHEYDWFGHNLVSPSDVPALRERWKAFEDTAAGGAGDALTREAMDAEQRFAYDIHEYKIQNEPGWLQRAI